MGVPKITPIIVAARAIPNNLTVSELYSYTHEILDGLLRHGIRVVSYASDGTDTERGVQSSLVEKAATHARYTIPHPDKTSPPISLSMPLFLGYPIVMIQDSKHALKTFRNNLYSGARLIVFGKHVATYGNMRTCAFKPDSPLFNRDLENTDRQDDNAALRTFSATTLEYLTKTHPDLLGQIIYVFIFGELVDAYQNRRISHCERIKMVLRAHFFLETWRSFLKLAGYSETRYGLSRQAFDIASYLIDGMINLVINYRDYVNNDQKTYALLPWLHATEACEHVFAECRKLVKDFTHLDFIYMVPRLHYLLRSLTRFAQTTDPKERAAGYAHTYQDTTDIDMHQLVTYPSDAAISAAANEAYIEHEELWELLGISPRHFAPSQQLALQPRTPLPPISSWLLSESSPQAANTISAISSNSAADFDDDWVSECGSECSDSDSESCWEAEALDDLVYHFTQDNKIMFNSTKDDDRVFNIASATVALTMDERLRV